MALMCVAALAFASCGGKTSISDPNSIDLSKYDKNADPCCWEITMAYSEGSVSDTETGYTWSNEYEVAAMLKLELAAASILPGVKVTASWKKADANTEEACFELEDGRF